MRLGIDHTEAVFPLFRDTPDAVAADHQAQLEELRPTGTFHALDVRHFGAVGCDTTAAKLRRATRPTADGFSAAFDVLGG